MNGNGTAERVATAIHEAFDAYQTRFRAITRRATERFLRREWRELEDDHGAVPENSFRGFDDRREILRRVRTDVESESG